MFGTNRCTAETEHQVGALESSRRLRFELPIVTAVAVLSALGRLGDLGWRAGRGWTLLNAYSRLSSPWVIFETLCSRDTAAGTCVTECCSSGTVLISPPSSWDRYQPMHQSWQSQLRTFILETVTGVTGAPGPWQSAAQPARLVSSSLAPSLPHSLPLTSFLPAPLPALSSSVWQCRDSCEGFAMLIEVWALEAWEAGGIITHHITLSPHLSS